MPPPDHTAAGPPEHCGLCKLWHTHPGYRKLWCRGMECAPPGLWRQARYFAAAAWRFVRSGFRLADVLERRRRRLICLACDAYRPTDGRCSKCGCCVRAKAAWLAERCPLGRW